VIELRCTYDPATRGGDAPEGRPSPKATLHWVSAAHALPAEVRLYDRLFDKERPDNDSPINPKSLEVLTSCQVEPSLKTANVMDRVQFERMGYFCVDLDSKPDALVFNRTVTLKDTWAKIEKTLNMVQALSRTRHSSVGFNWRNYPADWRRHVGSAHDANFQQFHV
jgi:glutaminyl-tRNA synthetase